jgi:hypothetical protein
MMILIYNILLYLAISVAWINAEPIIYLKRMVGFRDEEYDSMGTTKKFLHRLVTCLYCSSFWITLILTQSITLALIVSLFAFLLDKWN